MPDFKQRDKTDCGAVCLAYVLYGHKVDVSVATLRLHAGTTKDGTTALGLIEAARKFGFSAKAVKASRESIAVLPTPAILHTTMASGLKHYVVLEKLGRKNVTVMNPSEGKPTKMSLDELGEIWTGVAILLAPTIDVHATGDKPGVYRRLYELIMTQRGVLLQAFVGLVVSTALSLAMTVYVQKIIDGVLNNGNTNLLNMLGSCMIGVTVFRTILGYFQSVLALKTSQRIDAGLVMGYYRHLLSLPYNFFDTMRVGEITSRIRDAMKIREFINTSLLNLLLNPLILITSFAAMFYYSWRLALLSLSLVPIYAGLYFLSDWLNRGFRRKIMEQNADFDALVVESLHSINLLRTHRLETPFVEKTEARLVRLFRTLWSSSKAGIGLGGVATCLAQIYSVALLWLGANDVLQAKLTPGELMSCNVLAGYIMPPIVALITMNATLRETAFATERLYEILDLEVEKETGSIEIKDNEVTKIGLVRVVFHYPGRMPILRMASVTFERGTVTALVGESGCGKSSLLSLLLRLQTPQSGNLYVNDINIKNFTLASLRKSVCLVPQKVDLFSGTILENLAPTDAEPDLPRLIHLCKRVGLSDFIESLPQQYNTVITEGGTNFSGGQKQRMAIVRALYTGASAYLFDEPSSALDSTSKAQLVAILEDLRRAGRIIIVSTHDAELVAMADRVLTLSNGQFTLSPNAPASPVPIAG